MTSHYVGWRRAFGRVMKRLPKKWGRKARDPIPTTSLPIGPIPAASPPDGYYVYCRCELDSSLELSETTTGSEATMDSETTATESETTSVEVAEEIGELNILKSVPLDILYEVLTHVEPLDLLQVARSSKSLRKDVLTRSARSIWLDSFDNVGFYRRNFVTLDHVSEPRLASVLFESICNNCGGKALFPPQCESCTSLCPGCLFNSGIFISENGPYRRLELALTEKAQMVEAIIPQLTTIKHSHHGHYPPRTVEHYHVESYRALGKEAEALPDEAISAWLDSKTARYKVIQSEAKIIEDFVIWHAKVRRRAARVISRKRADNVMLRLYREPLPGHRNLRLLILRKTRMRDWIMYHEAVRVPGTWTVMSDKAWKAMRKEIFKIFTFECKVGMRDFDVSPEDDYLKDDIEEKEESEDNGDEEQEQEQELDVQKKTILKVRERGPGNRGQECHYDNYDFYYSD